MAMSPPPQPPPTSSSSSGGLTWANIGRGLTRAEVVFTAVAAAVPQIISLVNAAALNHASSSLISAASVAVFVAVEGIKDGWNKNPT
jgi:hypothetical protein